ncbi:craniofacial development protein 2 [Plakobranchus ocellatus]|uniref:Craniofacial development protein 2 n=1 Tax=Plakobranchus ocellatus TaxID=259542 RepID=A0AAV3ZXV3_9GAST|nr:craniofacial development protein 2 [Plakobranchus ocellatus]
MGDFKVKVGDEKVEDVVGPSGMGTVNERGNKPIKWSQISDFTSTNTWYQNHPRRQWIWKSLCDRSRNKIDYDYSQSEMIPKRRQSIETTAESRL